MSYEKVYVATDYSSVVVKKQNENVEYNFGSKEECVSFLRERGYKYG